MAVEDLRVFTSSMLAAASYDTESGEMTVTTHAGRTYTTTVDPDTWREFQSAPSKGRWYRENVMGLNR